MPNVQPNHDCELERRWHVNGRAVWAASLLSGWPPKSLRYNLEMFSVQLLSSSVQNVYEIMTVDLSEAGMSTAAPCEHRSAILFKTTFWNLSAFGGTCQLRNLSLQYLEVHDSATLLPANNSQQKPNNRILLLPFINGFHALKVRLLDFCPSKDTIYFSERNLEKTFNEKIRFIFLSKEFLNDASDDSNKKLLLPYFRYNVSTCESTLIPHATQAHEKHSTTA